MKKRKGWVAFAVAMAVIGLAVSAQGATVTIDGDLTDWRVNLQLYNTGDTIDGVAGTRFVANSFTPSAGIEYQATNDDVATDHGGELFDVEAVYYTYDADNTYFAVVTSSNPNGTRWDGYGDRRFGPGDLRLGVNDNGSTVFYGVGARPVDLTTYGLVSDIWGPTDQRGAITWDSTKDVGGSGTHYTTSEARVESGSTWSYVDNPGVDIDAYFVGGTGTDAGYAEAAWKQWAAVGDYYEDDPYGKDEPYGTWIYEVAVPHSLLSLGADSTLDMSFFALDCGNDAIGLTDLALPIGGPVPVVPEPMSMIFFGTGLVGVFGFVARRHLSRQNRNLKGKGGI